MATGYNIRISAPTAAPNPATDNKRFSILYFTKLLRGLASGTWKNSGNATVQIDSVTTPAAGTLTISSGSGSVGGTINGTAVTVTWATSDTASATALAVAINAAAAIVSSHVLATSALGVVTLTSKFPGDAGNAVTLAASGTGVTASGTRLTAGAVTTAKSYKF